MKSLSQFIYEASEKDDKKKSTRRGEIKFTIWETPDTKVKWLDNNEKYQKIEYKYEKGNVHAQFLLGLQNGSWKLWVGKIGGVTYDDDPYCTFDTEDFATAIVDALDKVEEMLDKIKEDPYNYIQFYDDI